MMPPVMDTTPYSPVKTAAIQYVTGVVIANSLSQRPAGRALELDSRQLPGIAPFAVEPFIGLGIIDEPPFLWIPDQLAMVPIRQVAEMTECHGAGADLHVADRPFASADAVQPIALVARGVVEMHVLLGQ